MAPDQPPCLPFTFLLFAQWIPILQICEIWSAFLFSIGNLNPVTICIISVTQFFPSNVRLLCHLFHLPDFIIIMQLFPSLHLLPCSIWDPGPDINFPLAVVAMETLGANETQPAFSPAPFLNWRHHCPPNFHKFTILEHCRLLFTLCLLPTLANYWFCPHIFSGIGPGPDPMMSTLSVLGFPALLKPPNVCFTYGIKWRCAKVRP